jgi:uncharacterized protein (DUF305 family)
MSKLILAMTVVAAAVLAAGAHAQEAEPLPPACGVEAAHGGHGTAMADPSLDEAHAALVAGMDAMHRDMDAGSKAEDIDVAFACAMIPHHQGAIDMAKAVLAHGDDPWIRSLAEAIIAAQEKEIADMRGWLEALPQ